MVSIVIPVFNQEKRLQSTFGKIREALHSIGRDYEIIFVDDGSADRSFDILKDIYSKYPKIKIIRLSKNFGQHTALLVGFELAKGEVIITMDADAKVSPVYIIQLLNKIKEGYDMVVCWRALRPGLGLIRRIGSFVVNEYTNIITGTKLHDHACSLKAFSRKLIQENIKRPEIRNFFGVLVARYAKMCGEIKVECNHRQDREASLSLKELVVLPFDFIFGSLNIKIPRRKITYELEEILG